MRTSVFGFFVLLFFTFELRGQQDAENTDYTKADSIAGLYSGHSLKDLKILSDKLTTPLATEKEKFRAIYRWVCANIAYDYPLYLKNKRKREKCTDAEVLREWNKRFSPVVFSHLLEKQKTLCTGYAYLVRELALRAGLMCRIVDGYGRTTQANVGGSGNANHSWNAIQLDKQWYVCDATLSSGVYDVDQARFVKRFDNAYFLSDPALFVRNHYPLDSSWMLLKEKPTLSMFLNGPLVYSKAFTYGINSLGPETFDIRLAKGDSVTFQFSTTGDTALSKAELLMEGEGPGTTHSINPMLRQNRCGLYALEYSFAAKGIFVVHILLDGKHAVSYRIQVN